MATKEQKIIHRKIEEILFSYNKYLKRIKRDMEYYNNPVLMKSYSLDKLSGPSFTEVKSDIERVEEFKVRISNDISRCEEMLFRIDSALEMVQDHKDYEFIKLRYFEGNTLEQIAEKLGKSIVSIYGIKNSILSSLEIHFKTQKLLDF